LIFAIRLALPLDDVIAGPCRRGRGGDQLDPSPDEGLAGAAMGRLAGSGMPTAFFDFRQRPFIRKLRRMPTSALLRFELLLFRRSFADAFSRKRDRLLLVIVLAVALLWLRHSATGPGGLDLPPRWELLALAAAPLSYRWTGLAARRLEWLAEESALAPAAADRRARACYRLAAQLPVLVPVLVAAALAGLVAGGAARAIGLAAAAHGAGALAARARSGRSRGKAAASRLATPSLSGPRVALLALLRVQVLNSARPWRALVLLVAASALATFAGVALTRDSAPGAHLAASVMPSLLLLAATARNDARLVGFLAFAGYGAGFVALAVCGLPAASLAAASAAALAAGPAAPLPLLLALGLLHLGAALIAVCRSWLSPGRDGRSVDFQVQVESAGLILLGFMLPPLALAALFARLWRLRAGYRDSIWLQP
jgi:hypothetical protein